MSPDTDFAPVEEYALKVVKARRVARESFLAYLMELEEMKDSIRWHGVKSDSDLDSLFELQLATICWEDFWGGDKD